MYKELLHEYEIIELEARAIEAKRLILRDKVLQSLKKEGLEQVESEFGKFTVAHKTSWKYSPKITTLAEKLKIAKIKEEEKGVAKPVISEYLIYKTND